MLVPTITLERSPSPSRYPDARPSRISLLAASLARMGGSHVLPRPDARRAKARWNSVVLCQCVLEQASALFGIPVPELRRPGRSAMPVARVRQIAMYVSHIVLGLSMRDVGIGFERDRTTVLHACQVVEELREAPEFDAAVLMMERLASALLRLSELGELADARR